MATQQTKIEAQLLLQTVREVHLTYVKQQIILLNALKDKFGPEVVEVVAQANSKAVCQQYLVQAAGQGSIEDLINLLWEPLRSKGYEFTTQQAENGVQMKCTACPWAMLYKNLGGAEWGYHLYCAADEHLVAGFNPAIGFKRTKTLMEGHDCCDHFYFMKD
jgi:predicted ArsR family transcriptional regulator